jgi:hypothetical protein
METVKPHITLKVGHPAPVLHSSHSRVVSCQYKCLACGGSGWDGPGTQNQDWPLPMRPIGVHPCSFCNGTGKGIEVNFEPGFWDAVHNAIEEMTK